jgi:hypothetical protein
MSSLTILGDTSGSIVLNAPAVSGSTVLTLPAVSGTVLTSASTIAGTQGASLVLLSSATASSSATIDFTSIATSGYSAWRIILTDVSPATDGAFLYMRVSTSSTFQTANYWYTSRVYGSDGGASGASSASDSTLILTGLAMDNSTVANKYGGELIIPNPASTTTNKIITQQAAYQLNGGVYVFSAGAGSYTGGQGALDGLRFYMNTGNIATGNFYVYGVKNA